MPTTTHEIDASSQSLGRIATRIATLLRGKDLPTYEPRLMPDVKVVVKNLDKVVFKGTKGESKKYYRFSGYPGGLRTRTLDENWARDPKHVLRLAVRGMLPPNRQRDRLLKNLVVQ